jgi:hypothetical protein
MSTFAFIIRATVDTIVLLQAVSCRTGNWKSFLSIKRVRSMRNGFLHHRYFECDCCFYFDNICLMGIITTQTFGVQPIFTKYTRRLLSLWSLRTLL